MLLIPIKHAVNDLQKRTTLVFQTRCFKQEILSFVLCYIAMKLSDCVNLAFFRLPIVQGGTFSFMGPTIALLTLPQWKCPAIPDQSDAGNTTVQVLSDKKITRSHFHTLSSY